MNRNHIDRGASALIVASSMFFLFGVAALAIDLAALRFDHRADRLATDAAATAGAASINPFAGSEADDGCEVAWDYLLLNLDDTGGTISPPDCSVFAGSCPATARHAPASAGSFSFVITHPVPDGDALMGGQAINDEIDGVPCQRFAVTARRTRNHTFARVLGFEDATTEVRSVARIAPDTGIGEAVPLVILEPFKCSALYTSGPGSVTVKHFEDTPGFIVVDSNGSNCSASDPYTIAVKGAKQGCIRALPVPAPNNAPSALLSYALSGTPGAIAANSYDPSDVLAVAASGCLEPSDPPETQKRLYPEPAFVSRRVTRAPIDHRYNCKASYLDYAPGVPVDPCLDAPAPHIDQLVNDYKGPGSPMGMWQTWTDAGYPCTVNNGTTPDPSIVVTGNWLVNCSSFVINNDKIVRFDDGDVVFQGTVDLRSHSQLLINQGSSEDRIVYIRSGDLKKVAFASITLQQTVVYLANGVVDLVGGDGGLVWTAPVAGKFEDLALWSESSSAHELGGQSGNTLTGTFFTPYADPFVLKGQGSQFQTDAQFLTRRLEVGGTAAVRMFPDPSRSTLIPIRAVKLIR